MECFEKYNLCKYCKELSQAQICHPRLTYLTNLMEDCDQEALESNGLFTKIQESLLQMTSKYGLLRKRDLNKIVSKYYIYVLNHRHLINSSPSYSPLRREDGLEFKQHLNLTTFVHPTFFEL